MTTPALKVENVSVSYGAIPALRDASLEVQPGQIVAVVGPNGAGKTTLVRAIAGLERTTKGRVEIHGENVSGFPSHRRHGCGLALIPQGRRVFPDSSVAMNLWAGAYGRKDAEVASDLEGFYDLFPVLRDRAEVPAGSLSGGEQQMLALARALMGRPKVLLLDEPSMGLAPIMTNRIYGVLSGLRDRGITMLLVEQNVARALEIADRVNVLRNGELVLRNAASAELTVDDLVTDYLGI